MKVRDDGKGDTGRLLHRAERRRDRRAPRGADGTTIDETHIPCVCLQPLGIALDPDGDIWYSEGTEQPPGPDDARRDAPVLPGTQHIDHYNIPNPVQEPTPGAQPPTGGGGIQPLPPVATTTLPHSVALDREGRVWYTGEASETVGYLDPAKAVRNTTEGFTDTPGPVNEFGRALAPADLAIDPAGTAWIADEYGDQIAKATIAADGGIHAPLRLPPDGAQQPRPTAARRPAGQPLVQRGRGEPHHAHLDVAAQVAWSRRPARRRRRRSRPSRRSHEPRGDRAVRAVAADLHDHALWLTRTGLGPPRAPHAAAARPDRGQAQRCLGRPPRGRGAAGRDPGPTRRSTCGSRRTRRRVHARRAGPAQRPRPRGGRRVPPELPQRPRHACATARGYRGAVAVGTRRTSPTCGPSRASGRCRASLVP